MANIFESGKLRAYDPQWEVVKSRRFSDEEKAGISECTVLQDTYDRGAKFTLKSGIKCWIPLEKVSVKIYDLRPGDVLDVNRLELRKLKYIGDDPNQKVHSTVKVAYFDPERDDEHHTAACFNNPFGLNL